MALSDDVIADPAVLTAIRAKLEGVIDELGARAGFLVDERGTPFAAVGHIEFELPHPLVSLGDDGVVLSALLGELETSANDSEYLVEPIGWRALVALRKPDDSAATDRILRRRLKELARHIATLL